jgi:hypothetical protein
MKEKQQIKIIEPCVVSGKDEPVGATPTVSLREARYLIGVSKAVAVCEATTKKPDDAKGKDK